MVDPSGLLQLSRPCEPRHLQRRALDEISAWLQGPPTVGGGGAGAQSVRSEAMDHDRVESREMNALVFGLMVIAYFVALWDASSWVWAPLLGPLAIYALRVAWPRVMPAWLALFLVNGLIFGINIDLNAEGAWFMVCLGASAAMAESDRWIPNRAVVLLAAATPYFVWLIGTDAVPGWPFWTMGVIISGFFGRIYSAQQRTMADFREAQARLAEQAAGEERRRIAREVHDLVGHSLTVVLLHVTGARRLVRRDPDEAEAALEEAEKAGRQSLADIRRTVGLLREEGESRAPTPTAEDLPALITDSAAAGLTITHDLADGIAELDETTGLAVYRITQESLANVARHAAGSSAHVETTMSDDRVELVIGNTAGSPTVPAGQGGNGLIGMQERAAAVGGTLVAGPHGTGWRVRATMPRQHEEVGA